jgi:hypothetical protein
MFAAFCASRLNESSDVFGVLPIGCDLPAIVARANSTESPPCPT